MKWTVRNGIKNENHFLMLLYVFNSLVMKILHFQFDGQCPKFRNYRATAFISLGHKQ